MTMPKKNLRRIVVNEVPFHWKASFYDVGTYEGTRVRMICQAAEDPHSVMEATAVDSQMEVEFGPYAVNQLILSALEKGWDPSGSKNFCLSSQKNPLGIPTKTEGTAEVEDTSLADHLDQLKESQAAFFAALKVEEPLSDTVVDNREVRWSRDKWCAWWKDADGKSYEVRFKQTHTDDESRYKRVHIRDGLFICYGKSGGRWAWFVFLKDREDSTLEW